MRSREPRPGRLLAAAGVLVALGAAAPAGGMGADPGRERAPHAAPGPGDGSAGAAAQPEAPPDLALIVQEARRVQFSDMAAWSRFAFRRRVEQQRLGPAGEVLENTAMDFRIAPVPGGFDELLLSLDGRQPTPKEVSTHRRQARFSKHYGAARAGAGGGGEEAGYSIAQLLRLSSYRYAGVETVDGVACHRLDFEPDRRRAPRGIEAKIAGAMAGSLWITADGYHLARAVARTVRPVPIALSIAKVYDLEVSLEAMPVARGVWMPRAIEVRADARVSWVSVRKRTRYAYSDFQPVLEGAEDGHPSAALTSSSAGPAVRP